MRKSLLAVAAAAALLSALGSPTAQADGTVRVTGDTPGVSATNGASGWMFARDPNNASPFEFNFEQHSAGYGALEVLPISTTDAAEKFIAEHFAYQPIADLTSISYDFKIAGSGTDDDHDQFYVNVYANVDDSTNFYDCRFDYVASTGSTASWTTEVIDPTETPTSVIRRSTARIGTCPATLAGMPAGSHVRAYAINVGDTSVNDGGLGAYLDNVVVTTATNGATTYDFEVPLEVKDACKDGGYVNYGFANQGDCVSSLQANANADK